MIWAKFVGRQRDHAWQHPGRLHNREARFAPERIGAGKLDDDVQTLVQHTRERMRRIEADRCQHRQYLFFKMALRPGVQLGSPLRLEQNRHTGFFQRRQNRLIEQGILPRHQRLGAQFHLGDHRSDSQAVHLAKRRVVALLLFQTRKAHLVKLIHVRTDDAQEAQALKQRKTRILSLRQYTFVERQHAEFTVEQRQRRDLFFLHFHTISINRLCDNFMTCPRVSRHCHKITI